MTFLEAIVQQQKQESKIKKAPPQARLGMAFAIVFGLSNIELGVGSGLFHASLAYYMTFLDNLGMYLVVAAPAFHAFISIRLHKNPALSNPATRFVAAYFTFIGAVSGALLTWPLIRKKIFPSLIAFGIGSELYARSVVPGRARDADLRAIVAAAICFVISYIAWLLDTFDIVCYPDNHVFQLHAFWHFGTALASFNLFLYYHPIAFRIKTKSTECSIV